MFEKFNRKKTIFAVIITLIPLNILAVYLVNQSIGIRKAINRVDDQRIADSLLQKNYIYNVFSAVVITLDLIFIIILLYFLFKIIMKGLKNTNL